MSSRTIWTTQSVEQTLEKYRAGMDVDLSFFHERNTSLKGRNVSFQLTPEEKEEFLRCSMDIVYFVGNYCKFLTDKGQTTVDLHPYQDDILKLVGAEEWDDELEDLVPSVRNFILMASRQTGKTTTISAFFAWYLCFHTDRNLAILANKQATSVEIVRKVTEVFKGLPYFLKPGIESIAALGMRLDNGCMLTSQATTENAQIGFTIHVLYIDEFAHIRPTVTGPFWRSVYPTLASSKISQCIISSTPNGKENLFYEIWEKSVTGKNTFANKRVDYWEYPGHDTKEWVDEIKANFGEEFFAQEFELKFDVTGNTLLTASSLKWIQKLTRIYPYEFVELEKTNLDDLLYRNLKWRHDFDPNRDINPQTDRFLISVDIAEGKEEEEVKDNDYNVATIHQVKLKSMAQLKRLKPNEMTIDNVFRIEQIGLYRDNVQDETDLAKVCQAIVFDQLESREETLVKMIVEMNFNGKAFLNKFSDHDDFFGDLIMKSHHTAPVPGQKMPPKKSGFKVRGDKDFFCKLAKRLIKEKTLIPTEKKTYDELGNFGKVKKSWKGIAGHDDAAMAELNIARIFEEKEEFHSWLYDFFEDLPDSPQKRYAGVLLKELVTSDNDIDDGMFNALYGNETGYESGQDAIKDIYDWESEKANRFIKGTTQNQSFGIRR